MANKNPMAVLEFVEIVQNVLKYSYSFLPSVDFSIENTEVPVPIPTNDRKQMMKMSWVVKIILIRDVLEPNVRTKADVKVAVKPIINKKNAKLQPIGKLVPILTGIANTWLTIMMIEIKRK